jgi:hypothetical protein
MEQTKIEVSKPILSPTRSLDEGFESDPDRISTDSELTSATQTPTFDLLHRTDRDGVQHTTITRHNVTESSPVSIICLDGGINVDALESESGNHNNSSGSEDSKVDQQQQQPPKSDQKHIYRRVKNKAPLPPKSASNNNNSNALYQTIQPRSQSVDRIRVNNDFNKSTANQNILAGRFVRVTVDPKQQYLNYFKNYKSYQHYQMNSTATVGGSGGGRLIASMPASGSTSNLYKSYHSSSNKEQQQQQPASGLLSLSNLSSSMMQQPPPSQYTTNGYSTVKVPKSYMQTQFSSSHHQSPQSHFLASSWTQSMDPRKARK